MTASTPSGNIDASNIDAFTDQVVLVDDLGEPIGVDSKGNAHRAPGQLHLAFSLFVFERDRMLLHRRAPAKYHFANLWTNACCSHPRPGEPVVAAARRRLLEELGMEARDLVEHGTFVYEASDDVSGLIEREFDHVITCTSTSTPQPDPAEIREIRWLAVADIAAELKTDPGRFTPWFRPAFEIAIQTLPDRERRAVHRAM